MLASAQTIDPRVVAAFGPDCEPVRETAIAAGEHKVIALFMAGSPAPEVDYAIYDIQSGAWSEGLVPMGIFDGVHDPSIAYDPQTGDFVAAALGFKNLEAHIVVARYDAQQAKFLAWTGIYNGGPGIPVDKPWVVAGEELRTGQEYYIVYRDDGGSGGSADGYAYRRSTDGGYNWKGGDITVFGQRVLGVFCSQPTVAGADPLYVAYMHTNTIIRFLSGQDLPGGLVDFSHLMDDQQRPAKPLEVRLNRGGDIRAFLPGDFKALTTPQLAADPSDPDRLYLVYHDTGTADPADKDVNIYLQKLTRSSGSSWSVGPRVEVNDPNRTEDDKDQFHPSVTVDDQGRIHVIFYDDRNYEQGDGSATPLPKFDFYYAVSTDQGATFTEFNLCADPPSCAASAAALDFGLVDPPLFSNPGEYIGISFYKRGPATEVWTSFTGTSTQDLCRKDKSVIFSSLIHLAP